jgi:RNA recognition motif-containing protein
LLLLAEFEQHGAAKAEIMMDKMTNRSRGFGFVWFNSRAGMEDAIRDKHNAEIDGRRISVKEAIPQEQIPPGELLQSCALRHLHIHAPVTCVTYSMHMMRLLCCRVSEGGHPLGAACCML